MKCKTGSRLPYRWLILAILAIAAISFDFAVTGINTVEGTFRPESEFGVHEYPTAKISIVTSETSSLSKPVSRTVNPNYALVEEMVRKAIELQGGFDTVVKKNDKVMLKINLVGGNSASGNGENTDVRVVKALMKIINEKTEGQVEIWIAEGSARANDDVNSTSSVWANSGYRALLTDPDLAGINFKLLNLNQTANDMVEVDLGKKGVNAYQGTKYTIHQSILEADVLIVVPVHKVHNTGITAALKLQIGIAPGSYYGYNKMKGTPDGKPLYHDVAHRRWTTEAIVDLCNIRKIDYAVIDALMCLDLEKSDKTNNRVRFNTILAGADPVAIDHVCTRLFELNPDDIAHITLAEKVGLGTNDPNKIEVLGEPIASVKKRIRKNQEENGKFGQSNRTWILSQAFASTNMAQQQIANEANLKPEPGKDGWSEPIYFFDDRIDLLSYYKGNTNMISYAYTNFYAPKSQKAELWLGTKEAIIVYLNGQVAYQTNSSFTYGDKEIGKKVAEIQLKQGNNSLLVKSLNQFGDYSFALNICEVESNAHYAGNRVEGLVFYQGSRESTSSPAIEMVHLQMKAFPNPAKDWVQFLFDMKDNEQARLEITNMNGQKIRNFEINNSGMANQSANWDLTDGTGARVKPGIYIGSLVAGGQTISQRVLVK
jgi:uncharacterized protein (DUF362 family)